ncbi:hypothetical protein D3C72_2186820 [compost metagenome]
MPELLLPELLLPELLLPELAIPVFSKPVFASPLSSNSLGENFNRYSFEITSLSIHQPILSWITLSSSASVVVLDAALYPDEQAPFSFALLRISCFNKSNEICSIVLISY